MSTELNFDIWPKPTAKTSEVSATKYWIKLELPGELTTLSMTQLTAVRKLVVAAYNAGRKA